MGKSVKKKAIIWGFLCVLLLLVVLYLLYIFGFIPHRKYTNKDFNIETYISTVDKDGDGVDDQTDILNNVKKYIATKPKYKSKYYQTGYPNDTYGVCTDVVGFGLKGAGYDLMESVNEHIKTHRDLYGIETVDKKIDFRRVRNLKVYLDHNARSLTTDIHQIAEWQGGDIVVFQKHIGIVSDKRNKNGITFVIHHANPFQKNYEEDILAQRDDIVGHYRIS